MTDTRALEQQYGPTAWFEELYRRSGRGEATVPWDRAEAAPLVVRTLTPRTGRAVVVGCGLGRDAEQVAGLGWQVTAFDVSPTAIAQARERHAGSPVSYEVGDLFALPDAWRRAFDLVVEDMNVQALPRSMRAEVTAAVASLVAPGGRLLVVGAAHDGDDAGPPWPLTRAELDGFAVDGVTAVSIESPDLGDGIPRWQAVFERRQLI